MIWLLLMPVLALVALGALWIVGERGHLILPSTLRPREGVVRLNAAGVRSSPAVCCAASTDTFTRDGPISTSTSASTSCCRE